MGLSFKLSISIVTIFMSICGGRTFEEDGFSEHDGALYLNDAVIINAPAAMRLAREADTSSSTQHGKQPVLLQPRQRIDDGAFGKDCLTTVGKKGTCKSFRDCFPLLKVAELSVGDGLAMGHYDTCSYVNGDNTEVFGVCCTEPVDTAPQETDVKRFVQSAQALQIPYQSKSAISNETKIGHNNDALRQIPAVWPPPLPPLPTHPPDHTAPTHPPSFIAGIIKPTTKIPAVYPTRPTLTTWPTIPTTTTSFTTRPPTVASLPTLSPVADGSCGIKNGPANFKIKEEERIVNGQQAQLNEFPWVVALLKDGMQFCGGSLVDNVHVLTAAHCIAHMTSWDVARLTVRLGDHNIRISTETEHVERKVKRIVRHRGFNIRTLHNDISILTLDQPVQFTKNVRPVCLPGPGDTNTYSGKLATVIGWGSLLENGPQPSVLQKVTIPIWMNSECRSMYGSAAPGGIVDHMMCAGNNNMDSCSGDSGGPLSVNEGGRWTQVGVVSWGIGCGKGQYPGVYTRVTSFLPWIQKNTMQY